MLMHEWIGAVSAIVDACTQSYRKGEAVEHSEAGPLQVTTINLDPPENEAPPTFEIIDMVMLSVGVDKAMAEKYRTDLRKLMDQFPDPKLLANGPSYIHLGAVVGDQGLALRLMALGTVLGFWDLLTPLTLHMGAEHAAQLAANGFLYIVPRQNYIVPRQNADHVQ